MTARMQQSTSRIGRLVVADRPTAYEVGTGEISITGSVFTDSLACAEALRTQFVDLAGSVDEPIVPVVVEDGFAGFCEIDKVTVQSPQGSMAGGWFQFRLDAAVIGQRPRIYSAMTQTVRDNANGVTTAAPIHAVPADAEAWSWLPTATAQEETRLTAAGPAGGDVLYRRVASGTGLTDARWLCAPEHWYQGACGVTRRVDHTDVQVVGRQHLSEAWRATNGLLECWLTSTGRLAIRWFTPAGIWSATNEFLLGVGGGFSFAGWRGVEITSLTPQQVTLRADGVRTHGRTTLWVTLQRGSRTVSVTIDTDAVPGHSVKPATSTPVTDAGWHTYQTTAVSDMHWIVAAADDFDVNLTTGEVTPDNALAPTWSFGISAYFDGASGDTGSRDQTARDWYATRAEQVRVG